MRYRISFIEFLAKVDKEFFSRPYTDEMRYGQILMNELYDVWPDKYHEITGTKYDCFYENCDLGLTLSKLKQEW